MALTKCKECGKEISTKAINCPGCGAPLTPHKKGPKQFGCLSSLLIVGGFCFALAVLGAISGSGKPSITDTPDNIWVDDQTANPSTISITRNGNDIIMVKVFKDGKKESYDLATTEVGGQTRYYLKGDNADRYCYIDASGDLTWVNGGKVWLVTPSKQTVQKAAESERNKPNRKELDQFREIVAACDRDEVIANLECSSYTRRLTITVNEKWDAMPYGTRLKYAKTFKGSWIGIVAPDPCFFDIVDKTGASIGGGGPSKASIWVD